MTLTALSDAALDDVLHLLNTQTGLTFLASRRREAGSRILAAMAKARLTDVMEFLQLLRSEAAAFDALVEKLTVNETYFFREASQFDWIRQQVLPELRRSRPPGFPLRIWSAGCASGEEPFSLAILLSQEGFGEQMSILGTDISRDALALAHQATYGPGSLRGNWDSVVLQFAHRKGDRLQLSARLRQQVVFAYLNLARDDFPTAASDTSNIDLILCRNVMIYFDTTTVARIAGQLFAALAEGGWLITGPSDPPLWDYAPFETVTTPAGILYRRGPRKSKADPPSGRATNPAMATNQGRAQPQPPVRAGPAPADMLAEAQRAFLLGDLDRVLQLTKAILSDPSAYALRVRALANLGDPAVADAAATAAAKAHPLSPELLYLQAIIHIDQGRQHDAVTALRRVLYLDHSLVMAHFALGAAHQRQGALASARRAFRNALVLCRKRPDQILPLSDGERADRLAEAICLRLDALEVAAQEGQA